MKVIIINTPSPEAEKKVFAYLRKILLSKEVKPNGNFL
jgi:hypothetical protein